MSIEQHLKTIANNIRSVFNAGFSASEEIASKNPMRFTQSLSFLWSKVQFPPDFNVVLKLENPTDINSAFIQTSGIKNIKLISDATNVISMQGVCRESTDLETIDFTEFSCKPSSFSYFAFNAKNLVSILGKLDFSYCANVTNAFSNATSLENIKFMPKTIKCDIDFHYSTKLSYESLLSVLNGLYNYNVDIDIANYRPDYATKEGLLVPGIYKITEVLTYEEQNGNIYVSCTTEPGYMFRVYKHDCGSDWKTVLDGMQVGNYIDFSGNYVANENFVFDNLNIKSNPDALAYTLNLGATNLEKLTDEEKQIATNKGWVLQ